MNNLISNVTLTCDGYVKKKPYPNYNPNPYHNAFSLTCRVTKASFTKPRLIRRLLFIFCILVVLIKY